MIVASLIEKLGYSLRPDHRDPQIVSGDVSTFRRMRQSIASKNPETHLAISYALEDRPTASDLGNDIRSLVESMTDLPFDSICLVAVLHREALQSEIGDPQAARKKHFRRAVHVHLLNLDLGSGRRVDPYFPARDWKRLREWTRQQNLLQGYKCPYAPENRRAPAMPEPEADRQVAVLMHQCRDALADDQAMGPEQLAEIIRSVFPDACIKVQTRGGKLVAKIKAPRIRGVIHINYDQTQDTLEIIRRTRAILSAASGRPRRSTRPSDHRQTASRTAGANRSIANPTRGSEEGITESRRTSLVDQTHPGKSMEPNYRHPGDCDAVGRGPDKNLNHDTHQQKTGPGDTRGGSATPRHTRTKAFSPGERTVGPRHAPGIPPASRSLGSLLSAALAVSAGLKPQINPQVEMMP